MYSVQKESQTNQLSLQKTKLKVAYGSVSKKGTAFQNRYDKQHIFFMDRSGRVESITVSTLHRYTYIEKIGKVHFLSYLTTLPLPAYIWLDILWAVMLLYIIIFSTDNFKFFHGNNNNMFRLSTKKATTASSAILIIIIISSLIKQRS